MTMQAPQKARRNVLQWLALAAAAPLRQVRAADASGDAASASVAASAAAAPTSTSGTRTELKARARDFVRMRGALDDRLVIGFLSGQYYGVVDDEITPLFGVLSATFARWRPRTEGGWWVASFEHSYFTDSDSGAVMASWRNPYTGRSVTPPVWSSEPARRMLTPDLSFQSTRPLAPGATLENRLISAEERADELVLLERVRFVSKPYKYAELVTLRASTAALKDPAAARVPCSTGFTSVSSWRPWQQMAADQPGHLLATGAGRYGAELNALPTAWLDATRRLRPALLQDPGKALEAVFKG